MGDEALTHHVDGLFRTGARALGAASRTVNRWVEAALCGLGLVMALLTFAQVVARYGLNHSIFWSEEVGRMILITLTFLGASAAWARGAHIGIDALTGRLPPRGRWWVRAFGLACGLGFGLFLAVEGARFSLFVRHQVMSATGVSRAVPAAVVPLGGLLLALHAAAGFAGHLARLDQDGR